MSKLGISHGKLKHSLAEKLKTRLSSEVPLHIRETIERLIRHEHMANLWNQLYETNEADIPEIIEDIAAIPYGWSGLPSNSDKQIISRLTELAAHCREVSKEIRQTRTEIDYQFGRMPSVLELLRRTTAKSSTSLSLELSEELEQPSLLPFSPDFPTIMDEFALCLETPVLQRKRPTKMRQETAFRTYCIQQTISLFSSYGIRLTDTEYADITNELINDPEYVITGEVVREVRRTLNS